MIGVMALERLTPRQPSLVIAMSTLKQMIPAFRLWELYDYSPLTGDLISKKTGRPLSRKCLKDGYIKVCVYVKGSFKKASASMLVWAWFSGTWPTGNLTVDHINRIRTDNRIWNLRLATPKEQTANRTINEPGTS